jgi:putative flippase GtrA
MKALFQKYREPIMYIVFGVLTTLVNFTMYYLLARILALPVMLANSTAFLLSILFAYVTNRTWVFTSHATSALEILKEGTEFFLARILGFFLDLGFMFVFVSLLSFDDLLMKGLSNIIVIVLNYVISKYIIFKSVEG